jgi:hypothetical protein
MWRASGTWATLALSTASCRCATSMCAASHWALELASSIDWQVQSAVLCALATIGTSCITASWLRALPPSQYLVGGLASTRAARRPSRAPRRCSRTCRARRRPWRRRSRRGGAPATPRTPRCWRSCAPSCRRSRRSPGRGRAPCGPPPCCSPSGAARPLRCRVPGCLAHAALLQGDRGGVPQCTDELPGRCRPPARGAPSGLQAPPGTAGRLSTCPLPASAAVVLWGYQNFAVTSGKSTAALGLLQSRCCLKLLPRPVPNMQAPALHRPASCMGALTTRPLESRSGHSSHECATSCASGDAVGWRRRARVPAGLLQDGQQNDAAEALALLLGALAAEVRAAVPRPPPAADAQARGLIMSTLRSGADATHSQHAACMVPSKSS